MHTIIYIYDCVHTIYIILSEPVYCFKSAQCMCVCVRARTCVCECERELNKVLLRKLICLVEKKLKGTKLTVLCISHGERRKIGHVKLGSSRSIKTLN